ncbi:MAG TPA: helix-turn-helix transcriptional regulator, partial [Albitalea sp.]|nr:helix-turn-helix transcriptional regulator [Albitalea sp.]
VSRACRLWMQTEHLHDAAALGQQIARSAGFSVFGLDAVGRVVHVNRHAERLLREADSLVAPGGRLSATSLGDAAALHGAIAAATPRSVPQSLAIGASHAAAPMCFVTVAGVPPGTALSRLLGHASVLVTARRRDQKSAVSPEQLAQLFGLTPAESSVTLALVDGKTPAEYAKDAGLSMPTVRTHLRAVFDKTQTRRQAETVRLLQHLA